MGGEVKDSPHSAIGESLHVGSRHLATEQHHVTPHVSRLNEGKTLNQRYLDKVFSTSGHHGHVAHVRLHGKGERS